MLTMPGKPVLFSIIAILILLMAGATYFLYPKTSYGQNKKINTLRQTLCAPLVAQSRKKPILATDQLQAEMQEFQKENRQTHHEEWIYGFIDLQGHFAIKPTYIKAEPFSEGLALVRQLNGALGFIDHNGQMVIGPGFYAAKSFTEERAAIQMLPAGLWGYIDRQGRLLIDQQFVSAFPFFEGLARVQTEDGWGYINLKGEWAVQPTYRWASDFHGGQARVRKGNSWYLINPDGKRISKKVRHNDQEITFSESVTPHKNKVEGLIVIESKGLYGYIDSLGKMVIQPQYDTARNFSENLGLVGYHCTETNADSTQEKH